MPKSQRDMSYKEGNNIGALIKQMRKAAGMSQMNLADKINVSYQQVQKYEKGASQLSVPRLLQIAGVFRVPVTAFLGDVGLDNATEEQVATSNMKPDEATILQLYRRMKAKGIKGAFMNIALGLVNVVEGRA